MKWKHPPIIKIYEALGAIADGRVEIAGNTAKVYSSSRKKYYDVLYDPKSSSIMANDNGSYWKGYLGYPSISYLMKVGALPFDEKIGNTLNGILWKDINQKYKNDFDRTLEFILASKSSDERKQINDFVRIVFSRIEELDLNLLGDKIEPPNGY